MRVIVFANQKGGVGKTTSCLHVGVALARKGRRILMIDMDKQHSLSDLFSSEWDATMFDVLGDIRPGLATLPEIAVDTYVPNLFLAPSSDSLVTTEEYFGNRDSREIQLLKALADIEGQYDYTLIDTSPGLGFLMINALVCSDEIVVPVQCAAPALRGLNLLIQTVRRARTIREDHRMEVGLYLRAVLPTFYHDGYIVDTRMLELLRAAPHPDYPERPMPVPDTPVAYSTVFEQSVLVDPGKQRTQTIFELEPQHPGSKAYLELAGMIDG